MSEKVYVPKVIAKEFGDYGQIGISFDVAALIEFANKHKDGRGYLKLNLCPRKEAGEKFGDTHYLVLDTWKPDPNRQRPQSAHSKSIAADKESDPTHVAGDPDNSEVPF